MVKHTFFPCDAISLTEKILLAMIVQAQNCAEIQQYLKLLINHSVVTERHFTKNCGKYVYFETGLPENHVAVPESLTQHFVETSTDDVLFFLYFNENKQKLNFLEITLIAQNAENAEYDEESIAHSVLDKMCFQAA
ncbi:hypothetical protein [Wielerella bovis]|uniref:hypothetical protein n=1 Tax=Wielerella bovis TaxID=2917790 RepID=UPI00201979DC|nr:hypothetical protein [Wielerella bovis]MCG7657990.1 hypothetical protein [Wielerella bovis]MCG7660212.1 hypothetical protein [Wielerella bovis]